MSTEILQQYEAAPDKYNPVAGHPDPIGMMRDSLRQGTLLAGREKAFNWEIDDITSEAALHRYRAQVEVEVLINLAERGPVEITISEDEKATLRSLYSKEVFDAEVVGLLDHFGDPNDPDFPSIDPYNPEDQLEHDVKAVEVYLGKLLDEHDLGRLKEWVHFGMTSEDTNNLAYNFMLRDLTNKVVVPAVGRVADRLAHLSAKYADTPTLAMTHAQKAIPTTAGKQFAYLLGNITEVLESFDNFRLSGKFSGAVGNHNGPTALFPDYDYDAYAQDFVESLGFTYASVQNQRNNHLSVKAYLDIVDSLAIVGEDTVQNMWLKILGSSIKQVKEGKETGSSTMTQKINPWRLENAENLFEQSQSLMSGAARGLVASRHERDLTDHGWERAYGDMIGRVIAGYNYFAVQLNRLVVDEEVTKAALDNSAEVLGELVQLGGRALEVPNSYDKVKELTQGKQLSLSNMREITDSVLPDGDIKTHIVNTRPEDYVGIGASDARKAVLGWHAAKTILRRGVLDESTSIDAVFFDLDDTLHFGVKAEVVAKLNAIFAEFESPILAEEIVEYAQMHDYQYMVAEMIRVHNDRNGKRITIDDFNLVNGRLSGKFDDHFYAPPESKAVIQVVRDSGKATGLVTTRGPVSLGRVLDLHGFSDSFDVIVGAGDVKRRKPHPEPLAIALGKLGVSPERSIYVGDDQDADVGAAKALGMKTALVGNKPLDPFGPIPTYHWSDLKMLARLYGRSK